MKLRQKPSGLYLILFMQSVMTWADYHKFSLHTPPPTKQTRGESWVLNENEAHARDTEKDPYTSSQ